MLWLRDISFVVGRVAAINSFEYRRKKDFIGLTLQSTRLFTEVDKREIAAVTTDRDQWAWAVDQPKDHDV